MTPFKSHFHREALPPLSIPEVELIISPLSTCRRSERACDAPGSGWGKEGRVDTDV